MGALETRLNRDRRSPRTRAIRGLLLTLGLGAAAAAIGVALHWAWDSGAGGAALACLALLAAIGLRAPYDAAGTKARTLADAAAPGRDPHAAARQMTATLAERLTDSVIGPGFWFVLLGLLGFLVCRAVAWTSQELDTRRPRFAVLAPARAG